MRLLAVNEEEALYSVAGGAAPGEFDASRFIGDLLAVKTADNLVTLLMGDNMRAFALGLKQHPNEEHRFLLTSRDARAGAVYQKGDMGRAAYRRNLEYLDAMFDSGPFPASDLVSVPFGILSAVKDFASAVFTLACWAQGRVSGHAPRPIKFDVQVYGKSWMKGLVARGGKPVPYSVVLCGNLNEPLSSSLCHFAAGGDEMQTGNGFVDIGEPGVLVQEEFYDDAFVAFCDGMVEKSFGDDGYCDYDSLIRASGVVDADAIERRYCAEVLRVVVSSLLFVRVRTARIGEGGRVFLADACDFPIWRALLGAVVDIVVSNRVGVCSVCGMPFVSKSAADVSRRDTCGDACRQRKRTERKAACDGDA